MPMSSNPVNNLEYNLRGKAQVRDMPSAPRTGIASTRTVTILVLESRLTEAPEDKRGSFYLKTCRSAWNFITPKKVLVLERAMT